MPRAPLSFKASLRRARRLLFVLGVGYALHLPYLSIWKIVGQATAAEKAVALACQALLDDCTCDKLERGDLAACGLAP